MTQEIYLKQQVNSIYKPLFTRSTRYFILMGGRGAGRSTVASQYALANLVSDNYFRCAIMRYVFGDIRNSIYKEITDRVEENGVRSALKINESSMTITHGQNSIAAHGFKKSSGSQSAKLKSLASYNCIIIEEAEEITEDDFIQLDDTLRTMKGDLKIIFLLNPPAKTHWIIQRWFNLEETAEQKGFYIPHLRDEVKNDVTFVHSTYHDNKKNIEDNTAANYESYKHRKPAHYYNMIRGLVPEVVRGKIFNNWKKIASIPHEARLIIRGLDFGYTNDPTAIIDVYWYNGGLILDERVYKTGMLNSHIQTVLKSFEYTVVMADSAEPKSIDEINGDGVTILPAPKGADSIVNGINKIKEYNISATERSTNLWLEYDNYAWLEDKEGNSLNIPKPGKDHLMDALRYAITGVKPPSNDSIEVPEDDLFDEEGFY